ncbi:MAG: phage head-tail connector protein [Pseudomonadota bacterium]
MIVTELTAPAETPVSLAELKDHLRLNQGFADEGAEDGLVQLYLDNAVAAIEQRLGQALVIRSFQVATECWDRDGVFRMPIGPVVTLTGLDLISGETANPFDVARLAISPGRTRQVLSTANGLPLPPIPGGGRAEIRCDAGYGASGPAVPGELRQAVLVLAAHLYENRDGDAPHPALVSKLIAPHAVVRI